jgi:hypothetical protein
VIAPIVLGAWLVVGADVSAAAFAAPDATALEMPEAVAAVLLRRAWKGTPGSFRVIALSHVADGCAARAAGHSDAARRCVARALELARGEPPKGYDPAHPDETGLYASHLNLILGAQDRVGGPHDGVFHARLSRALAARSAREPTAHIPSYKNTRVRWPADQSATLASLRRFDEAHGEHLAGPLARAWEAFLDNHSADGLPWSEVTGHTTTSGLPRGCGLSFGIRYTSEFDPSLARRWWALYKHRYLTDSLLVGFREWPPGHDLPADADSGPIVMGVGAAATAFGLAAAREVGDGETAGRLATTARVLGSSSALSRKLAAAAQSTLAQAVLFQARP